LSFEVSAGGKHLEFSFKMKVLDKWRSDNDMELKDDKWIWVVIDNPEKNEKIVGQQEEKSKIQFIPAYQSKEEALQCMNLLARHPGSVYEAQAILYEDLARYAADNGFMIFMLDGFGTVTEKIKVA